MDTIETIDYRGYTIEVYPDYECCNPYEEWDFLGTFYHWHRRGFFGEDISGYNEEDIEELLKDKIWLPVYLYEHSGQTINTTGFSCPWDSGQVGFIAVEKSQVLKEWDKKRLTKNLIEKAKECLKGEIKTLDDYLTGNVYGYRINKITEEEDIYGEKIIEEDIDSCWGFFGNYDEYMVPECKSIIDWHCKQEEENQAKLQEIYKAGKEVADNLNATS